MNGYVCAFRGRRDDYQVPLALAEAGRLDRFITDAYAGPAFRKLAGWLPATLRDVVLFRHKPGLCDASVRCLWVSTLAEQLCHRTGRSRAATFARIDPRYSEAAAARARHARANLLLYTPYAWEAFTAGYAHQPRRVLFQYHPHAPYEEQLLRQDLARYPEIVHSFAQETGQDLPEAARRRVNDCWRHADGILAASTFTRRTLLEAGADPDGCMVAPYGIETGPEAASETASTTEDRPTHAFEALFVGSGVQRKGLHHLLRAWGQAALPRASRLTLVCRHLDPGLRERVACVRHVRLLPEVSQAELTRLYQRSTLFVMPSLVEGFGQVYLEALSHGCPVLGTANTCLPDLGAETDGVFLTAAAEVDQLVHRLETLAQTLPGRYDLRTHAQACASRFTWPRFRAAVLAQL